MANLRDRVKDTPRDFCCAGYSKKRCYNPQYPKNPDADESIGCQGFRCTRCKGTVGWCRGVDHGDDEAFDTPTPKKSSGWCDDCWCDVYGDAHQAIAKSLARTLWVTRVECEEYGGQPRVILSIHPLTTHHFLDSHRIRHLINKVRKLGINYPIYLDTGNEKICLTTPTS